MCGLAPQGGVTKTLRFEFAPEKANLVFEQDNGEFTAEIGLQSHFTSFTLGGRTYGAVGRWRSDKRFELEVRCAESSGGRRMIFTFEGDALTLETESTMSISGGIARPPVQALHAESGIISKDMEPCAEGKPVCARLFLLKTFD